MFGNAPRVLWERWATPDAQNRILLACRALLVVEDTGRTILFETGIGAFFAPKLKERYGVVEDEHVLLSSLARVGFAPSDIDVIVLSHLHFDHAGGLLARFDEGKEPQLAFPKAQVIVSSDAWERAKDPHPRDRASFIPELPALLEATGRLDVVADRATASAVLGPTYRFVYSDGHTPGLLLTVVETARGPLMFMGDLVPGAAWVNIPITMGYDRFPERVIDEKAAVLDDLYERGGRLFFTHDPEVAVAGLGRDDRGRYEAIARQATLAESA